MISSMARHRDSAILIFIHLFGLSYFIFFLAIVLFQHFPSSLQTIPVAQGLMCYGGGVIVWCMCSLTYRVISILFEDNAAQWQRLESAGTLLLIYTATVPFIVLQFSECPYLQVGYVFSLTIITVGNMVDVLRADPRSSACFHDNFHRCILLGLFALAPVVHSFSQAPYSPPELGTGLIHLACFNLVGSIGYFSGFPERSGLVGRWNPSLYIMHLILVLSNMSYSKKVLGSVNGVA